MIEYSDNGLIIQPLTEILAERENVCKDLFGDDFIISGESSVANLQAVDADREYEIQELLLFLANQLDPDQAEGLWLDYICALNNISRYTATKSTIPLTIHGTAGTTKNAGEITIVDDSTDEYYINTSAFVIGDEGTVNITAQATSYGAITALSTSTFSLKTPSIGIDSITYNTEGTATVGRDTETDDELRARREEAVSFTASSILSSIKATVSQISNVSYINAYENDTMNTVDTLPPKSFEIVVEGGDEDEIAKAIFQKKPSGIQAYGTTTKPIIDDDGNEFTIGFTRPTKIPIDYKIEFISDTVQTDEWKNDVKAELIKAFNDLYNVGDSVYAYNLYYVLNAHPEIKNVTFAKVKKQGSSDEYNDAVAIGKRQLATLSAEHITITQASS